MRRDELAVILNDREYGEEITKIEEKLAKESRLVVVFGASDDLMEFRGAIDDEIACYGGAKAYLTGNGLLENECENDDCPHFKRLKDSVSLIEAKWNEESYSWIYETTIPHSTFDIIEDGEKYCRGIVFNLYDVPVVTFSVKSE